MSSSSEFREEESGFGDESNEPRGPRQSEGGCDAAERSSSAEACSSSSAESRGILLPIESLPVGSTRVEISDVDGRRLVACVPVPEADVESDRFEPDWAMARDGNVYQCRWTEEDTGLEGSLVIRFYGGDNLLEIANATVVVPRRRVFTYEPYATDEPDATGPNRVERYMVLDEEEQLIGLRQDIYHQDFLLQSSFASPNLGCATTEYGAEDRAWTKGWPTRLPFSSVPPGVTRITISDSAGRLLAECQPVSEEDAVDELNRPREIWCMQFVAMSRDGDWYRGEKHDDLPFGESLTIRMHAGERVVCVQTVVVEGL